MESVRVSKENIDLFSTLVEGMTKKMGPYFEKIECGPEVSEILEILEDTLIYETNRLEDFRKILGEDFWTESPHLSCLVQFLKLVILILGMIDMYEDEPEDRERRKRILGENLVKLLPFLEGIKIKWG